MLKYKVYFEEDSGTILAITNVDQEYDNFFETDYEDIAPYVEGTKTASLSKVVYNINTSEYNIISKEEKLELLIDDLIYKITPKENYQLGVWKNNPKRCWTINLSESYRQDLEKIKSRPNQSLIFSITQYNNPNILYRHFSCMLNDLIDNPSIDFEYASQDEEELTRFSVYTSRKFEKYTCGVIDG